jgi:UDP-N-acetylglucosamine 2-epimerase (non-hydrolysing)
MKNVLKKKISIIFGTRPEAIKLAPVIIALRKSKLFDINVCVTAQHRQMLDQVLELFNIKPDRDLNIMRANQSLALLTSNTISALDKYISETRPDMILVQGDTTTVLAASIAGFYHKIPIGHVEAGLRTYNKYAPFPEEINRVLTARLADLHFAPTFLSKQNLISEGVHKGKVFITGNTVIDALLYVKGKVERNNPTLPGISEGLLNSGKRIILITGHRRENFGKGFESMCKAIALLAQQFPNTYFVYPVHLNPNVREPVFRLLGDHQNVLLIDPLDYFQFVYLMTKSYLILTDSGGIQEEGPSLGKPVLVMRDTTERPEGIEAGTVKLVGSDTDTIVYSVSELLNKSELYHEMSTKTNPYGDGRSSEFIVGLLEGYFTENDLSALYDQEVIKDGTNNPVHPAIGINRLEVPDNR